MDATNNLSLWLMISDEFKFLKKHFETRVTVSPFSAERVVCWKRQPINSSVGKPITAKSGAILFSSSPADGVDESSLRLVSRSLINPHNLGRVNQLADVIKVLKRLYATLGASYVRRWSTLKRPHLQDFEVNLKMTFIWTFDYRRTRRPDVNLPNWLTIDATKLQQSANRFAQCEQVTQDGADVSCRNLAVRRFEYVERFESDRLHFGTKKLTKHGKLSSVAA